MKDGCGLVIKPPYNPENVAKSLLALMKNDEKLKTMGYRSIEVSKEFELPAIVKMWNTIFKSRM